MYEITRKVCIDAGHRIPDHTSECRNLHGHRYEIHATCQAGDLQTSGPERGMVIDFSVVREELEKQISHSCDHGLIVDADDETMTQMLGISKGDIQWVKEHGAAKAVSNVAGFKIYLVPFPPTCEHLAKHWYAIMSDALKTRTNGRVHTKKIRVYETPNSYADFPGGDLIVDK
jgi:6-pyruvoyltetrahydropterin/6-carboxytetrahydropterin synthase